jgi:hypothetical protein
VKNVIICYAKSISDEKKKGDCIAESRNFGMSFCKPFEVKAIGDL